MSFVFSIFAFNMAMNFFLRRKYLMLCFSLLPFVSHAQLRWNSAYQQYFNQYKDLAIEQMKRFHIPASITLAQGVFESGAGMSELARKGNNHFGIKCHNTWRGPTMSYDDDSRGECFRAYKSAYESYEDHSRFLVQGQRYQGLFKLRMTDYKSWARGLKAAGYATNPRYADKLIDIIQLYKLYQYDTAKSYDHFYARHSRDNVAGGIVHPIYEFNDNYYIKVRQGDTFASLAKEIGISARKLAKYNERDRRDALETGEIIYLKKKRTKAPKSYKGRLHYVRAGQSMYTIAQLYGIRLKNLYKLNHLSPDYQIKVGDGLRVR